MAAKKTREEVIEWSKEGEPAPSVLAWDVSKSDPASPEALIPMLRDMILRLCVKQYPCLNCTFALATHGKYDAAFGIGTFALANQALDLHGTFDMDARLSQTTTGVKSFLLRAVNPFFAKPGGGTRIPFKIGGTAKFPIYSLDRHRKNDDKTQTTNKSNSADTPGN